MPRGRPPKSQIRQHVVDILFILKRGYGYQIFLIYQKIFPRATMRSIYYHLNRGTKTGEIAIERVQTEKGDYSWGPEAEKVYYVLGPKANPHDDERVRRVLKE